jgi:hypothetical protein
MKKRKKPPPTIYTVEDDIGIVRMTSDLHRITYYKHTTRPAGGKWVITTSPDYKGVDEADAILWLAGET